MVSTGPYYGPSFHRHMTTHRLPRAIIILLYYILFLYLSKVQSTSSEEAKWDPTLMTALVERGVPASLYIFFFFFFSFGFFL